MFRLRWFSALFILLITSSCGKEVPSLQGIDKSKWMADNLGCSGYRKNIITQLQQEKDKLLGLNELKVVELLGRPNENELYKRNQKFYYYHLTPSGTSCSGASDTTTVNLIIRFNAMGLAKEVAIE